MSLARSARDVREGFIELAKLDGHQFSSLLEAVASRQPSMYPNETAWWPQAVSGVPEATLRKILEAAVTLRWIAFERGDGPTDSGISDYVQEAAEWGKLDPASAELLKDRSLQLVSVRSLAISSRAFFLAFASPNCLVQSRIVSDIRTVFENAKSTKVEGAIILHNLQMECTVGRGDTDKLYITLDNRDLDTLIGQLQRAKAKGEALATMLQRADVKLLPVVPPGES